MARPATRGVAPPAEQSSPRSHTAHGQCRCRPKASPLQGLPCTRVLRGVQSPRRRAARDFVWATSRQRPVERRRRCARAPGVAPHPHEVAASSAARLTTPSLARPCTTLHRNTSGVQIDVATANRPRPQTRPTSIAKQCAPPAALRSNTMNRSTPLAFVVRSLSSVRIHTMPTCLPAAVRLPVPAAGHQFLGG